MRKIVILLMCALFLVPMNALANEGLTKVEYSPPTETLINGVPESELIETQDLMHGPYFVSYNPNGYVVKDKFKPIASFSHDNTRNSTVYPMKATVKQSSEQGSEWGGALTFSGEIKAGILGKVKTEVGVTHKETRVTNEAVGYEGTLDIKPGNWGYINLWYKGRTSSGTVRYYYQSDSNSSDKVYSTKPVVATFYRADHLEIHSEAYQR